MIQIGDRVRRVENGKADFSRGEEGIVSYVSDENITVHTDSGIISKGNAPHKLKVIERATQGESQKPMLKKINNFMKTFLNADVQSLLKAGFINGDLLPTAKGIEALNAIQFQANLQELVKLANEAIAEAEAEDCKK